MKPELAEYWNCSYPCICKQPGLIDCPIHGKRSLSKEEIIKIAVLKERNRCMKIVLNQMPDVDDNTEDEYRRGQKRACMDIAKLIDGRAK